MFFLDRTFGSEKLAEVLRGWTWTVEVHRRWFPSDRKRVDDDAWIPVIAEKKWRIISCDKDMESRYHEAIAATDAAIFIVAELDEGEDYRGWVRMLGSCKDRIVHDSHFAPRPFVARISRTGNIYLVNQLLPHGRVKNVTTSVANNATLYLPDTGT